MDGTAAAKREAYDEPPHAHARRRPSPSRRIAGQPLELFEGFFRDEGALDGAPVELLAMELLATAECGGGGGEADKDF